MNNFSYFNPVRIFFGKGQISLLGRLIPPSTKILMLYGGGSIKKNGVYDQVKKALKDHSVVEFSGVEPNPLYETCLKALEKVKKEKVGFILAVGGGSVLDAAKFIAASYFYEGNDPWEFIEKKVQVSKALPLASVMTLPATGSEMNPTAVISRKSTNQKLAFASPAVYPQFSILDPETTFSLPPRQTINGIVDAYIHVMEQYLTWPVRAQIQDRFSESILITLMEEGPKVLKDPKNYDARANVMWAATAALNGYIGCGVPQDWSTHTIGHEITAEYGLDHAQTLAIVLIGMMKIQREKKKEKLIQYGERVFGIKKGSKKSRVDEAIKKTEKFFRSLGQKTKLSEYGLKENVCEVIANRMAKRGIHVGEHKDIDPKKVLQILQEQI